MLSIIQKRIFLNTRRNICHQHHRFGLPKHFLQPFGPVIIGVLSPNLITYKNPCYNICPFSHSSRIFSFYSLPEGIPVSIFATASVQKNTFSHDRQHFTCLKYSLSVNVNCFTVPFRLTEQNDQSLAPFTLQITIVRYRFHRHQNQASGCAC